MKSSEYGYILLSGSQKEENHLLGGELIIRNFKILNVIKNAGRIQVVFFQLLLGNIRIR